MSHTKDPDAPPPYAAYTTTTTSSSSSSHQTILNRLSTTRTRHIQSIIEQHILPIIHERTTFGIAQTTLALLPSDIPLPAATTAEDTGPSEFSFSDSDTKPVEVIGFSSEDSPIVVRLQGAMNKTEFWRPQVVIDELENLLSLNLNPSLDSTVGAAGAPAGSVLGGAEEGVQQRHHSRRNFLLSRVMPSLGPEQRSPGNNPEVGVRQAVDARGVVMVKARLEEICLRTVSEFGLFDTMSKQCVIIRVDARC